MDGVAKAQSLDPDPTKSQIRKCTYMIWGSESECMDNVVLRKFSMSATGSCDFDVVWRVLSPSKRRCVSEGVWRVLSPSEGLQ